MPYYFPLRSFSPKEEKKRIIERLLALRQQMVLQIPQKTAAQKLLIATWNIREFGKLNRTREAYYYIAEIIAGFDLVAVQEIGSDLASLQAVMNILGYQWDYIVSDSTAGTSGGGERMAIIFDKHKVKFNNIAGEIVLPENELVDGKFQFARTPVCFAFQAGWYRFMICTVHMYFGEFTNLQQSRRAKEVAAIASFLRRRAEKENYHYLLLGDFNITAHDDLMVAALKSGGFSVPTAMQQFAGGQKRKNQYDQVAFRFNKERRYIFFTEKDFENCGAFDYYESVLRPEDAAAMKKLIEPEKLSGKTEAEILKYYLNWRTFQMSDHIPVWVELTIDFSNEYLKSLLE